MAALFTAPRNYALSERIEETYVYAFVSDWNIYVKTCEKEKKY